MFKKEIFVICLGGLFLTSISIGQQAPWFTGPIENNYNVMLQPGELYLFPDIYRDKFSPFTTFGGYCQIAYQYTEKWQVQLEPRYNYNTNTHLSSHDWGDLPVVIGYQLSRQQPGNGISSIKLNLIQTFPTGRYEKFNPNKARVEPTGSGHYSTGVMINTQHLTMPIPDHYLKRYFTLEYSYSYRQQLNGFNTYGGGIGTDGTISGGQAFNADLAYELQFTQNWVGLIQGIYNYQQSSSFSGLPGVHLDGSTARVFQPTLSQWSLFQLIEYNFSKQLGLDFGFWLSLNDRQYKFRNIHLALNYVS